MSFSHTEVLRESRPVCTFDKELDRRTQKPGSDSQAESESWSPAPPTSDRAEIAQWLWTVTPTRTVNCSQEHGEGHLPSVQGLVLGHVLRTAGPGSTSPVGSRRHCSMNFGPWLPGRVWAGTGGAGSPVGRIGSGWTLGWLCPAHRWLSRGPRLCSNLDRGHRQMQG